MASVVELRSPSESPWSTGIVPSDPTKSLSIWAEREKCARFILDDHLSIVWSNEAAAYFCERVDLFRVRSRVLRISELKHRENFSRFIRTSTQQQSSLCLSNTQEDHILCVAINLINGGRQRTTGVTLRQASSSIRLDTTSILVAFQLTPSEQRIVETLFAGFTAEEVSDSLGLCIGTIRVHIRHIYGKLDVCSREAMFHKLRPFACFG